MKKLLYSLLALFLMACVQDDQFIETLPIENKLEIAGLEGLKFQNSQITDGSLFNLKTETSGRYILEIRNHFNELTSKSVLNIQAGDNIKEFYTKSLKDGDYTLIISKDGKELYNVKQIIQ